MKNKDITSIVFVILLGVALVGGVVLVRQKQETRRGAFFSTAKLFFLPDEQTKEVDKDISFDLWVDTAAKVDGVKTHLCLGKNVANDAYLDAMESKPNDYVTVNSESNFSTDVMVFKKDDLDANNSCVLLVMASNAKDEDLKGAGTLKLATIKLKTNAVGSGQITIDKTKSLVTGPNTASETDKSIEVTEVGNATYTITAAAENPTPTQGESAGEGKTFKYKVSYGGVKDIAKCATGWKVKLIALGNGTSQVYNDTPVKTGKRDEWAVFSGEVKLNNFAPTSNVAIFIKGEKSLQVKYGKDGQDEMFNAAGGEISTADESAVHDFSNYALLAGDVAKSGGLGQDGYINALDFTYVKNKALSHAQLNEGENEPADLDGNCSLNTRDVDIVRQSLNEKQGQLY